MNRTETFKQRIWIIIKPVLIVTFVWLLMLSLFFTMDKFRGNIKSFFQQEFVVWILLIIMISCAVALVVTLLIGIFQLLKWLIEPLGVEVELLSKYYVDNQFQGWHLIWFVSPILQFRWFTDCGYQFLYIHIGKRHWRLL